ncbi:glycoside hydrolase family 32 protein [Microbacterium sp. SS28]|uniref:glycoside hydrolase family 32 protein n=1 Tax=Microbacterium sp. SS28 TaxID=2919948 RepID=UPI001FAAA7DD|nr:glycoside hydrolase family 32 protein [Microbacterium sp. SS28]
MPTQDRTTSGRRRLVFAAVAVTAVVALLVALGISLSRQADAPETTPSPEATPAPASPYERPAGSDDARPAVHLTPSQDWMNDPQRPFLLDGVWHYYYLYNADHPDGNGTAWYHATSTDLVHWTDQGVAIDKYTNGLGDIWTGTAVVDHENTAGFGPDAVVAMATQQDDGVQRQSLFVSRDGGYRFEPYEGNPVIDNPGVRDFRDPRLLWDDAHDRWVMTLAEGDKIGFYTSPDLKDWTYRSGFTAPALGVLECPDLFPMAVDGDPSQVRWVLAAGANGAAEDMTTGTVYWTGSWDGETFTPDDTRHQWLDRGADYYAAVTWDDPRLSAEERLTTRYGIGWLNNWAYAGDVPGEEWSGGSDTIVREIRLMERDGRATLSSTPLDALQSLEGPTEGLDAQTLETGSTVSLPEPASDAYRMRIELAADDPNAGELRVHIPRGADGAFATVGYDPATGQVFVTRDADAIADRMPDAYRAVRTAPVVAQDGRIRLDIVVDVASIEVFTGDGSALSMVSGGAAGTKGLRVEASGGEVRLEGASISPLRVAPVGRRED